jgi:hypothetical protein
LIEMPVISLPASGACAPASSTPGVNGTLFASKLAMRWRSTETKYATTCTKGRLMPNRKA